MVDTEQTGGSLQKIENFSADLACTRPGFSPSFGAVYRTVGNSGNDIANSSYVEGHGGIKLTVPSLGSLTVGGQLAKITRPNVKRSLGREDNTDITRAYLSLDRAVAPRLQFSANIGYLRAVPVDPAVAIFSGLSFQGKLAYAFTPQLRLTLEGQQDVQNSSGVSSTYVVRKEVRGGMDFDIFNKTTISLTAAHVTRRFVGNDNGTGSALSSDILDTMSLRMNREIGRRLRLGVTANLQKRDANLALYDYDSASVSATLGAKF